MARYKQLLYYAKKLPPMPQEEHVDENKVKGCVSQVRIPTRPTPIRRPSMSSAFPGTRSDDL